MDFAEPISYPLKDLKKLVIGGILLFPGMILLLIPAIMAVGYSIKVAGDTIRGKDDLPEFDDWGYFLMKGLGYVGISMVYAIIMYATFVPAAVLYFIGSSENIALMILAAIFGIVAFVLVIILMFIEMIAIVRYGEKENIGAAFAFKEIFRNFKSNLGNYIIGLIILFALYVVFYIAMFIAMITIVGIIFIGILLFYWMLVIMRMFAQIYKESKEKLSVIEQE